MSGAQRVMPASERLLSIDVLRGIAVLAVVVRHLPFSTLLTPGLGDGRTGVLPEWVTSFTHYGEYGVHLFLVISGFCIHLRWARRGSLDEGIDFLPFWRRRLLRLYPPYFIALLGSLAAVFVGYGLLAGGLARGLPAAFGYQDVASLLLDLGLLVLLLQNLTNASQRVGNGPFWSLALEEQLYMLYFPLLWLRRRVGWSLALGTAAAVSAVWRSWGVAAWEHPPAFWYVVGPAHWFEWALGALAVEAHLGRVTLPSWARSWWAFALLLGGAVMTDLPELLHYQLPMGIVGRDPLFGAAFFVLVNRVCEAEREQRLATGRLVEYLGRVGIWSYSIYLTHNPLMVATKQVLMRLGAPVGMILVGRIVVAILAGYLFHRLVEQQFISAARRLSLPRRVEPVLKGSSA
ncbi:MAG: acyltransferase [Deltaproteobacteria bacterium]|nr:acyltransferase [Deltaproteobacteria bacterium]